MAECLADGYFRRLTFPTSGHNVGFANNAYLCYSLIAGSIVLVTLLAAKQCRPVAGDSRDERNVIDRSFATCVIANLLVSPITWDHYFLLLSLPTLILWHSAECVRVRVILLSMIAIMAANPSWIWNPLIAGDHELAALWGGEPSVATAWQTVSLIAYPCYTLVALFVFTLLSGRANSISSMVEGDAAAGNGVNEKRAATTVAAR